MGFEEKDAVDALRVGRNDQDAAVSDTKTVHVYFISPSKCSLL